MKIDLNIELLTKYLGPWETQSLGEYTWQCPECAAQGGDTHKDNLKFNDKKKVMYCFADSTHFKTILSDIYKQEHEYRKKYGHSVNYEVSPVLQTNSEVSRQELSTEKLEEFKTKMLYWNNSLLNDEFRLKCLDWGRGINKHTVENVFIGINALNQWALPTIKYTTSTNIEDVEVIGFEYRAEQLSKKKISREKGTPSHLAMINMYEPTTEILIVVEGYFDGYALYQYLSEKGQLEYYHIVTCSNGVNSLQKQLEVVDFSKYKKYFLFIDNDKPSRVVAEKIIEEYPFFENITSPNGFKDFNDYYLDYKKQIDTKNKQYEV